MNERESRGLRSGRRRRRFIDARQEERCKYEITLKDGSKAQCGRRGWGDGQLCGQHHRVMKRRAEQGGRSVAKAQRKATTIKEPCRWLLRGDRGTEWVTQGKYTKASVLEVFMAKPVRPMTAADAKAYTKTQIARADRRADHG